MDFGSIREEFNRRGFAVVKKAFTNDEINELRYEMDRIIEEMNPNEHSKTVFTATDEAKLTCESIQHISDEYFLNSSDKIRFFYEDGALDDKGQLKMPKNLALNKVGHALHWLNPTFKRFTFSDKIKNVVREIVYFKKPAIVQSMYIFKPPRIGGEVTAHCDAAFLHVTPISHLLDIWVAIDATSLNGCLHFSSDSHQGTMVLIHGLVKHKSGMNNSERSRHAYTFHVVEKQDTEWSPDNWLQATPSYSFPLLYEN